MNLLVTQAMPQMQAHAHPQLGRLVTPRHCCSLPEMAASGLPWAADNDCFQGLDMDAYDRMLDALVGVPGCLFVCVPDVVADAAATVRQWVRWQSAPRRRGLPLAFVAQDGCERGLIPPWWTFQALFIGGSTEWKLGPAAERLVREAKHHGKHVHMGRVNTARRRAYAAAIGCDSIDGTSYVLWRDRYLDAGLHELATMPIQGRLPL